MTVTNDANQQPAKPKDQQLQQQQQQVGVEENDRTLQHLMRNGGVQVHNSNDGLTTAMTWSESSEDSIVNAIPQQQSPAMSDLHIQPGQLNGTYGFGTPLWQSSYISTPPHQFITDTNLSPDLQTHFGRESTIPRFTGMNGFFAEPSSMDQCKYALSFPGAECGRKLTVIR